MKSVHQDLDNKKFEEPEGIYTKYVNGRREIFADGTSPHYTNKIGWYRASQAKKRSTKKSDNNNNNNNKKKKSSNNNNDNGNSKKKSRSKSLVNNED